MVGSDSHPADFEIGNYIGAQNAAANLAGILAGVPLPPAVALLMSGLGLSGALGRRRRG